MRRGTALMMCGAATLSVSNAAAQNDRFTRLEAAIVEEHNLARSQPQAYVSLLRERIAHFDGRLLRLPGEIPLRTSEGADAVNEAIQVLEDFQSIPQLRPASGMSAGARDHVSDQGNGGGFGHTGTDDSEPWDRISRYGDWTGSSAENIAYGPSSGREVVLQLIVDDGVSNRGHRTNIFNPDFRAIGVACGPHREFAVMCVITYANGYVTHSR